MHKYKKIISFMAIVTLIANGLTSTANAASLTNAKDLLSTSNKGSVATHTITFNHAVDLTVGQYFEVVLPADFGDINGAGITCPAGMASSLQNTETARCTSNAGTASTSAKTITLAGVTNPAAVGSQMINIASKQVGGAVIESVQVLVAIVDNVTVTANVASALTFTVSPLATSTAVNGAAITNTSATTSLSFGTLTVGTSTIMGQELRVTTNADNGYTVTVEQNQNLTSQAGSDIDSFIDGTSTAPTVAGNAWQAPATLLDQEWTYGHFGFTSEDATLAAGDTFGDNLWKGFNGTTTVPVLYHDGPADGSTANKGATKVAYRIQISALQEAGDYTNVLTYIATPTY